MTRNRVRNSQCSTRPRTTIDVHVHGRVLSLIIFEPIGSRTSRCHCGSAEWRIRSFALRRSHGTGHERAHGPRRTRGVDRVESATSPAASGCDPGWNGTTLLPERSAASRDRERRAVGVAPDSAQYRLPVLRADQNPRPVTKRRQVQPLQNVSQPLQVQFAIPNAVASVAMELKVGRDVG